MKRCLLAILLPILCYSCSKPEGKKEESMQSQISNQHGEIAKSDSSTLEPTSDQLKKESVAPPVPSSTIPQNAVLPFGSELLVKNKLRKEFLVNEDNYNLPGSYEHLLVQIDEEFGNINQGEPISQPQINEVEVIRFPMPIKLNDSLIQILNGFKYKLPNFGPFDCFYTVPQTNRKFKDSPEYDKLDGESPNLGVAGNLVLIDPKTNNAKVLNVYASVYAPYYHFNRQFFINKDKTISVFEFDGVEGEINLTNKYIISVSAMGEIKIVKQK